MISIGLTYYVESLNNTKDRGAARTGRVFTWIDRVSRWFLAGIFLFAGVPKIFSPGEFASIIEAYGLVPEFLLLPAAIILPLLEIVAAVQLIRGKRSGLWLSAILMIVFISVLTYGIIIGLDIDCGCFGPEDIEHKAFSSLKTSLLRDVLLCIPLVSSMVYSYKLFPNQNGDKR